MLLLRIIANPLLLLLLFYPLLLAFTFRARPLRVSSPLRIGTTTVPIKCCTLRASIGDLLPGVNVGAIMKKMTQMYPHDEQEYYNAMAEAGTVINI